MTWSALKGLSIFALIFIAHEMKHQLFTMSIFAYQTSLRVKYRRLLASKFHIQTVASLFKHYHNCNCHGNPSDFSLYHPPVSLGTNHRY